MRKRFAAFKMLFFYVKLISKWFGVIPLLMPHMIFADLGGFFQEVNTILQHVVERNRVRRSLSAKRNALRSWRNLVETLLTACPADLIPADERQLIIRDLLLDLHDKVSGDICYTNIQRADDI